MKKIINLLLLITFAANTMSQTIDEVLNTIELNNNDIKAAKALYEAQTMEVKSQNMLGNTSVAYEKMLGTIKTPDQSDKITVTQELDFPSIYAVRGKVNSEKIKKYQYDYEETRRSVLLQAKELCLDLVMLDKQQKLINERLSNIIRIKALYEKRYESGDVNKLEMNKIILQEMNEKSALAINTNERNRKLKELIKLNAGNEIELEPTEETSPVTLPDFTEYSNEATEADMRIKQSVGEYKIATGEYKIARNRWLPSLGISYIREIRPADTSNGFEIGVSVPLLNNIRKVKQSKAYKAYTMWQMEKVNTDIKTDINTNYDEARKIWETLNQYDINLVYENINLLNKSLGARQISMIEYFTEINSLYDTIESYNLLLNSYNKILARMYKFRL